MTTRVPIRDLRIAVTIPKRGVIVKQEPFTADRTRVLLPSANTFVRRRRRTPLVPLPCPPLSGDHDRHSLNVVTHGNVFDMRAVFALAAKDIRLLFRDRAGFVVTFVFPLVYAIFLGVILAGRIGSLDPLAIAIVDHDRSPRSIALIDRLSHAPELNVVILDAASAADQRRHGRLRAVVLLPEGFGTHSPAPSDESPVSVKLSIDPQRTAEREVLQAVLEHHLRRLPAPFESRAAAEVRTNAFLSHTVVVEPWTLTAAGNRPRSHYELSFPQGIIWGVLGCTATFGVSLVTERTRGTLFRLQTTPLDRTRILLGKATACFATTITLAGVLWALAVFGFGVRPASFVLLTLTSVCVALAFAGVMMLLAVLGKTEQAASGATWAVLLGMAMLGGGMVPHFFMPPWLQGLAELSPVRWAIVAMDGSTSHESSAALVLPHCALLLALGTVCFALGARLFRWMDQP